MEKQLPKSWVETTTKEISTLLRGVSYGKTDAYQEEFANSCLILRGGNIQDGKIVEGKDNVFVGLHLIKEGQFLQEADVVIVGSTGSKQLIGKAAASLESHENVSFGAFLMAIRANKNIDKWFFSYYFQTDFYRESIRNLAGGVNINNIRKEYIENLYFPLPPLAEQNRIVAKLDSLFVQLKMIKTSMATIPVLLKKFRQQVLTQAVTGKLTENWRVGKELEEWKETKLSDFSISKLGKMLDGAKNTGELINYLGNINVRWCEIDFANLKQLKIESIDIQKYILLKGDILVCEGGDPGRAAIWKYERTDVIFQKALHRVRLNDNVLPDFFLYNLKTDSLNNKLVPLFTGTTIKHLTARSFATYTISIPLLEEQQEIVSRVERLLDKADAIEKQYKTLKEKIDNLPQAMLHKAFKGELVEQLESDGDARELLKEIQELRAKTTKMKKK
jgi:type I restriction enzyme S subunit